MATEYNIKYHTHNAYDTPVKEALFAFLVAPCEDESQEVRNLSFRNSFGVEVFQHLNAFGFEVTCVRAAKPFTDFEFQMTATVEKKQLPFHLIAANPLSASEEERLLASQEFRIDHHLYLSSTKYTTLDAGLHENTLRRQPGQSVFAFLQDLNAFIYRLLEFDTESTHVHTTVNEVLKLRRGVCQDFSHLFLAIARENNIPCRYVSGYLNQGGGLTGAAVMHAWVEAFVPGLGWRGFDPTNHLLVDDNHLKAAHGSDYSDCSPIKGMLKTTGGHETSYKVQVVGSQMPEMAQ